jgi:hypothetical protein
MSTFFVNDMTPKRCGYTVGWEGMKNISNAKVSQQKKPGFYPGLHVLILDSFLILSMILKFCFAMCDVNVVVLCP